MIKIGTFEVLDKVDEKRPSIKGTEYIKVIFELNVGGAVQLDVTGHSFFGTPLVTV